MLYAARPSGRTVFEESCLETLKLQRPVIPAHYVDGTFEFINGITLQQWMEEGLIAKVVVRKRDKVIIRVNMKAKPNQIATRITAVPTVVEVGPENFWHKPLMGLLGNV